MSEDNIKNLCANLANILKTKVYYGEIQFIRDIFDDYKIKYASKIFIET